MRIHITSVFASCIALTMLSCASTPRAPYKLVASEHVWFSGYRWDIRTGDVLQGAGPNYWSGCGEGVVVRDEALRLELAPDEEGIWRAAEVSTPIDPGTRRIAVTFELATARLDPNVVLGIFGYLDDTSEFDFELATWGEPDASPLQFVVVPAHEPGHMMRFDPPEDTLSTRWTQVFEWGPRSLRFTLYRHTREVASWIYKGKDVPRYDGHRLHINLWLMHGLPPRDLRSVHVDILDVRMQ